MTVVGILSDTHGYLDERVFKHFASCDQIWHAGDIGSLVLLERLQKFKPTVAVFGNTDGNDIRRTLNEFELFEIENVNVLLTHIGGYPGRYNPAVLPYITKNIKPHERNSVGHPIQLFVCGHSHILKIQYDSVYHMLTINPGAAGRQGWQVCQTLVRLSINGDKMQDVQVIEL